MTTAQTELDFAPVVSDREVEEFVSFLEKRRERWTTAAHYLAVGPKGGALGQRALPSEDNKRFVRALAQASNGRICGGCKGYRLTVSLNDEEYGTWRSAWLHSASEIRERVARADRVRANAAYTKLTEASIARREEVMA